MLCPSLPPPARTRGDLVRLLRLAARRGRRRRSSWCSADATRVPVVAEMTIGRAPGSTLVLEDPTVSRTHARISPGNGGGAADRGRRVQRTARGSTASASSGPMTLRDGARIRLGDSELRVERRRDASEAGRTIVVRAGREPGRAGDRRAERGRARRRSSGCARACAPATRSSGSRRARATAAGCSRTSRAGPSCASATTTRSCFEQLDGEHSLADLIGDAEARFGADRRRRGWRGCWPTSASAGFLAGVSGTQTRHGRRAAGRGWQRAGQAAREDVQRRRAGCSSALYRRGGWVLFTRPVLIVLAAARGVRRRRVRVPDRRALRHAVRGRRRRSGSAGWCSCVGRFARRRRARAGARPGDGVVRAPRRTRRAEARARLPVRVRGHVGGVVRAAPAADRDQRRRAGVGLHDRRGVLDLLPAARRGHRARHLLPARVRGVRRRAASTSTRSSTATATTSSSTCCASRGCGGGRASSSRGGCRAARRRPTRRCSRATRCSGSAGRCWPRCSSSR